MTSSVTSHGRSAGRQCMKVVSLPVRSIISLLTCSNTNMCVLNFMVLLIDANNAVCDCANNGEGTRHTHREIGEHAFPDYLPDPSQFLRSEPESTQRLYEGLCQLPSELKRNSCHAASSGGVKTMATLCYAGALSSLPSSNKCKQRQTHTITR